MCYLSAKSIESVSFSVGCQMNLGILENCNQGHIWVFINCVWLTNIINDEINIQNCMKIYEESKLSNQFMFFRGGIKAIDDILRYVTVLSLI